MIGSWASLEPLMRKNQLEQAREQLLFELSQYKKMKGYDKIIVVFDAHLVMSAQQSYHQYDLQVVYTKQEETADAYIEREVSAYITPQYRVVVATSDYAEQWLVFQRGAIRQSAKELEFEVQFIKDQVSLELEQASRQLFPRNRPLEIDQLLQLKRLRQQLENKDRHT